MEVLEHEELGERVVEFLTASEQKKLRIVCRRWHFTCTWIQYATGAFGLSKKSALNMRSRPFQHQWTHFIKAKSGAFLKSMVQSLPEASRDDTYALKMGLCESTNTGVRPSFANPHARSGYTISKINRCGNFPGILLSEEMKGVRARIFGTFCHKKHWQIGLYGGGPGYDSVGFVFLAEYLRDTDVSVHTVVYDNEPGWRDAVSSSNAALRYLGYTNATWAFEACDITEDVGASINGAVQNDIAATDLFVFSFVCVENYQLLRDTDAVFLRSLFQSSHIGSLFFFVDSTHRLWPMIWRVASDVGLFRLWVPYVRGCHHVLILEKLQPQENPASYPFYDAAIAKLDEFDRHMELQYARLRVREISNLSE